MRMEEWSAVNESNLIVDGEGSETLALRCLIHRADQLIKEMEFALSDVPASVDEHISMLRLAIADARQQVVDSVSSYAKV